MAKIVACAQNKGGDGKTHTSIMLADYLAIEKDAKVLLIDLDPQANFSRNYIRMQYDPKHKEGKIPCVHPDYDPKVDTDWPEGISSIAYIFYGEPVIPYPTPYKNIEICPAYSHKLLEAEHVTKKEVVDKVHLRLAKFLSDKEVQESYDYIIIDTPPSKGPLTISALKACDHLIIPSQMEPDSIEGIYGVLQLWKQEKYVRPAERPIKLIGIVANRVEKTSLHTDLYNVIRDRDSTKDYVIPLKIKKRIIYAELRAKRESVEHPKSVFNLPKTHVARKECENVCKLLVERMG